MNPAMYIFLNRGASMTPGKAAAQASHAAVEAYRVSLGSQYQDLVAAWYVGGHYTKLVMLAEDEGHLYTIERYLIERGFEPQLIIDEGRTEIRAHTATALGVPVVDRDDPHTKATFESFQLYKEPKQAGEKPKPTKFLRFKKGL